MRGDVVEIFPASRDEHAVRVEFFGDEIERIREVDALTGEIFGEREHVAIFPASHFVTREEKMKIAIQNIEEELEERLEELTCRRQAAGSATLGTADEIRFGNDAEMGFCSGIENYSRHLTLPRARSTPYTLLDYFPDDFLMIIDESHVTIPQIRGMYNGDRARKEVLVEHGFRLPSALDNRPLRFEEFEKHIQSDHVCFGDARALRIGACAGNGRADHPADRACSTRKSTSGRSKGRSMI